MAKSGTFTIFLKARVFGSQPSGGDSGWGEGTMFAIRNQLLDHFSKILVPSTFQTLELTWDVKDRQGAVKTVGDTDLVVYFLNSNGSLIASEAPSLFVSSPGGLSVMSPKGAISEVYLDGAANGRPDFAETVANLAFHELMHNKLDVVSPVVAKTKAGKLVDVHVNGGGGLATSGTITGATPLTPENVDVMARNLNLAVPQYTGGLSKDFYAEEVQAGYRTAKP